jgi:TrmH family RNA methyltransferase
MPCLPARGPAGDDEQVLTKADLQRLRSLRERKHREALGVFVVEGEKVVAELLADGFPFLELYGTPEWRGPADTKHASGCKAIPVTTEQMARISHFPTPSSVLAVGKMERQPIPPGAIDDGLTLALDGVQDPGNVGTLLRIADWFGCARLVLSPECADVFHQKAINASMASFARIPNHVVDLPAWLSSRSAATPVLGCDLQGQDVHELPPARHAVIVVGSEGRGLSAAVRQQVTRFVTIPRFGGAESLNAAVAAAIVCDNLRRTLR